MKLKRPSPLTDPLMNTVKIFLASSEELAADRKDFRLFVAENSNIFEHAGITYELIVWENFTNAMAKEGLQAKYNEAIKGSDIFILLYFTKVGKYTNEEFDTAHQQFLQTGKPSIYTYLKNSSVNINQISTSGVKSKKKFEKKLNELKHYKSEYKDINGLKLDVLLQLGKLHLTEKKEAGHSKIPHCLSAGQPSVTADFTGREKDLETIKTRLDQYGLLLINAEGGMGKTTLTAQFLKENAATYQHFAWFFCENGITEEIKKLAPVLGIDLKTIDSEQHLIAIKTAMENLEGKCLLVLDNANTQKDIEAFKNVFDGLSWHVLLTSRCNSILPNNNEYILQHLAPATAKALFKNYYNEASPAFETLLDKLLQNIGYNTLLIEILSKTLKELSATGETLAKLVEQLEEKGLYMREKSFEIQTTYTTNVHKQAATTDDILEILYDVTKLDEAERLLLVNLAVLPAENHPAILLIEAFMPEDNIGFSRGLKKLAQKGWLHTDSSNYRMSPVVQKIIIEKNRSTLYNDAEKLIENIADKLEHTNGFLVQSNYKQAQVFAELAKSIPFFINEQRNSFAYLLSNLGDYYKGIGNFRLAITYLEKGSAIYQNTDQNNYAVCLERQGSLYQQQGDFKKALQLFEQYFQLRKELFEANPHSEGLKNGLAIAYERLGNIYQQQGDFKKALQFFEMRGQLGKELFEANPHSEGLKNGLAVSYSKLGDIYQQQGDFKKALQFFEQYFQLRKELFEANPHSEGLKNGLAIAYERLGDIYQQQGD
ncbi:MAG: tetratricopeptide repeat protein, partial [Bacteroidetes bacterium]|nr:tetratricopeptide repeat protein [Bacteroidota bacterium]